MQKLPGLTIVGKINLEKKVVPKKKYVVRPTTTTIAAHMKAAGITKKALVV